MILPRAIVDVRFASYCTAEENAAMREKLRHATGRADKGLSAETEAGAYTRSHLSST